MLRDCEISIDEVKNLGDYIEIEYKGTNDNVDEVIAILCEILNEIEADVGPADYKGYAYNILNREKMEVKDETKEEIKVNFGVGGDICGGYQRIKIVEFESLDLESCKK